MTTATATQTITCRLAQPDEGPVVQALCATNGYAMSTIVDWTLPLGANWILAYKDEELMGCIMVNPGAPFGRIEYLIVQPTLSKRWRAKTCKALVESAILCLKRTGSQLINYDIRDDDHAWRAITARHFGGVVVGTGTFMVKGV
jgi:hypothetical protein